MEFVRHYIRFGAYLAIAAAFTAAGSPAYGADSGKPAIIAAADEPFVVAPTEVKLVGKLARAQLLATQTSADGRTSERSHDLTHAAIYSSDAPGVVQVTSQGQLLAQGNGRATITVRVGKRAQTMKVEVVEADTAKVGFVHDVAPVLSKLGCNSASCHASQHGKGGFKLSVFGYAPDEDFRAMVREWQGRRSDLLEPEKSLILLKPLATVPHGGNKRLEKGSVEYRTLLSWLSSGAPAPTLKESKITRIEVTPRARVGKLGFTQQLRVTATYEDGAVRDVTALAKYDSMDEGFVSVTSSGMARAIGKGQAPIVVRYEGHAEATILTVPYSDKIELKGWKNNNFIDELAEAKFREVGIEPSELCDDATFVRRAYLDAVGTLPTVSQVQAFIDSKSPNKRAELIDALLGLTGDPAKDIHNNAYAAYWSLKWADLIRSSSDNVGEQGMWALHNWIQDSFRQNKPYDKFVRELVLAKGSIYMDGPSNFYRIAANPPDMAETTAQLFLGVRLQCAKCHHHPMENYGQEDYYSFAAFFARVGTKNSMEFGLFGREQVVMVKNTGDVRHPKTGAIMPPTPLEGKPVAESLDRRQPLADWLASADNEYFARNLVNRYMGYLMGRGLVEPIDDLRATNPASNPLLLDALAEQFAKSGFDVKQLLRTIMTSRLYQLDSQPTAANAADDRFYSHYEVKRMGAETLLDAIDVVTGSQTKFKNMPLGTRAIELPDSNYPDYFLATFGKPRRVSVCECERVADENLAQALHTLNGDILAGKIADKKGRIANLVAAKKPYAETMTDLYMAALARKPSPQELAALEKLYKDTKDPKMFYEDVLWSLCNSKQFLFVH
ncbi:MAG: S-layer related protein (Precursor) [Pirellula sp.]|nr:S-layer related protein (Precursor) [Pirellula sp.]